MTLSTHELVQGKGADPEHPRNGPGSVTDRFTKLQSVPIHCEYHRRLEIVPTL